MAVSSFPDGLVQNVGSVLSVGIVPLFCLRRPHFFQQRKKWGKERRQKLRFCISSRAMPAANLLLRSTRSRRSSCVVPSKDCLSNSAAAADAVRRTTLLVLPLRRMSGSGARGKSVRHTARHGICSENAWYLVLKSERYSAGGFLNRRFKWRFCLLLPPKAKVGRAGARNTPSPRWQPQNSPLFYTKTPLS